MNKWINTVNENNETTPRERVIAQLSMMIESLENLPPHALVAPISHYDYLSLLLLLREALKAA